MAVLDTFFLLFEADASRLTGGLADAEDKAKKTTSAVARADDQARMLGNKFNGILSHLGRLVIGTLALNSFRAVTQETIAQNVELGKQAAALRVNVEHLQQWQGAFASVGSSAEAINGLFGKIGAHVRDPEARIMRLADRMKGMSEYGQRRYGKMLGLDPEAIALMRQGSEKIEELMKKERELGIVTKDEIEASKKAAEQMRVTNRLFCDLRNRIALAVLPAFKWLLQGAQTFIRFLREHEPFTKALFIGLATGITALYLPAVMKAIAATYAWLATFLAIGAAAALIALIVDDILVYLEGGDSMLGRWEKKFPAVKTALDAIKAVCRGVRDFFEEYPILARVLAGIAGGLLLAKLMGFSRSSPASSRLAASSGVPSFRFLA